MNTKKNKEHLWGNTIYKEIIVKGLNKIKTDKDIEGYIVTLNFAKKHLSKDSLNYINKPDKNYFYFQESNSNEWLILAYELLSLKLVTFNHRNYSDKAFEIYLEYEISNCYKKYSIEKGFYIGQTNETKTLSGIVKNNINIQKNEEKPEPFSLDIFVKELLQNNHYSESDDIIDKYKNDIRFIERKGDNFYNNGKFLDAKKCYLHALQEVITIKTLYNLGVIYLKEKNFKYAEILFKQVINKDSKHTNAYFNLGFAYISNDKNMAKALNCFKKALILNPDDNDCKKAVNKIENSIMNEMLKI